MRACRVAIDGECRVDVRQRLVELSLREFDLRLRAEGLDVSRFLFSTCRVIDTLQRFSGQGGNPRQLQAGGHHTVFILGACSYIAFASGTRRVDR